MIDESNPMDGTTGHGVSDEAAGDRLETDAARMDSACFCCYKMATVQPQRSEAESRRRLARHRLFPSAAE